MKKIFLLIMILIIPILFLCSCSKDKYFEGTIVHLEYKESTTEEITRYQSIWTGKFAVVIPKHYIRTYPDRYYINVKVFDEKKQKYKYYECYVTKEYFEKLKIGDWFIYDNTYCFDKEPFTEERT